MPFKIGQAVAYKPYPTSREGTPRAHLIWSLVASIFGAWLYKEGA